MSEDIHDELAGVDVNDFTSTTTWGVFNDPQVWEPRFESGGGELPDTLRQMILETPMYTDEDAERALRHARLTNEDRQLNGTLERDGMVLIKSQITLRSPWTLSADVDETGTWVAYAATEVTLDTPRPV